MNIKSAVFGSALAVAGCGGASSSREFEGRKTACIQVLDRGIRGVERFGGVIEDLGIDTRARALQAGLNLNWLKAESEEVIKGVTDHCDTPELNADIEVQGMIRKFSLMVKSLMVKIVAMGTGKIPDVPIEIPRGQEI